MSSQPEHQADVEATAELISALLRDVGCPEVSLLRAGGHPAVFGHYPAPAGQPTVLLYAHYDVQPPGTAAAWDSDPFEPRETDGRLYARGSADDKAGVALHLAVLRALGPQPPIGIKLLFEGEEEIGSPTMAALLDQYRDELAADIFVIADAINADVGMPSLTTTLRGNITAEVTVSTAKQGLHSGQFGGPTPDALTALVRLLATLHDDNGDVAIAGLVSDPQPASDYPADRLYEETGLLPGVEWIGTGSLAERMWVKPSASVIALDTTRIADASNTLIPSASAKLSIRIAPSDDPARAQAALREHLLRHAPWGVQVEVTEDSQAAGLVLTPSPQLSEVVDAAFVDGFGCPAARVGIGGSIALGAGLAERYPDAEILLTAVADPTSYIHSHNESLELADLRRAAIAELSLLRRLASD